MKNGILIIDYGSQYTQLITRRIRELKVYSQIVSYDKINDKILSKLNPCGIILSGGPNSALEKNSPNLSKKIFAVNKPILGICYGMQILCKYFGGEIAKSKKREYGNSSIKILNKSDIIPKKWKINSNQSVWMSHGDHVKKIPKGFSLISSSNNKIISIIQNNNKKIYGLQFHPEVEHTKNGFELIKQFVYSICKAKNNWKLDDFISKKTKEIKKIVKKDNVICALSGGVDSSVTAYLIHKSIKKQLFCIFVDHGLLREGESQEINLFFKEKFYKNFIKINAKKIFLEKLKGISHPEKKRKIIGKTFIEVFEKEAKKIRNVKFLAQGTLYPDIIESISATGGPSVKIKSHHNVGGLPKKMNFKILEPLKELFKDEVRILGKKLNLDSQILNRHPFPGPGLAIRIPGEVNNNKIFLLKKIDKILIDYLKEIKIYNDIWQAFSILLPIKSVGVMGDNRTYNYTCVIRAVKSNDGMTADYYFFSKKQITEISNRIINNVKMINRVLFDFTTKPPGTIEWE